VREDARGVFGGACRFHIMNMPFSLYLPPAALILSSTLAESAAHARPTHAASFAVSCMLGVAAMLDAAAMLGVAAMLDAAAVLLAATMLLPCCGLGT